MYNKLEEYNGWTNKPTWIINDWILNDEYLLNYIESIALEIIEDSEQYENPKWEFEDRMKDYFETLVYEQQEQMDGHHLFSLLNFAFAYVNWKELAQSYYETVEDELIEN